MTDAADDAALRAAVSALEELYETEIIHCTLAIGGDDAEAKAMAEALSARDHTVGCVTQASLSDERPTTIQTISAFCDGDVKALVLGYGAWVALRRELELGAMGHNVLWIGNVAEGVRDYIVAWVKDAHRRGLMPNGVADDTTRYHTIYTPDVAAAD